MDGGDQPIYENSTITKLQAILLVLTFALRHSLCDQALEDLLALLNIICPGCVPQTKYLVSKIIGDLNHEVCFSNIYIPYFPGDYAPRITRTCQFWRKNKFLTAH